MQRRVVENGDRTSKTEPEAPLVWGGAQAKLSGSCGSRRKGYIQGVEKNPPRSVSILRTQVKRGSRYDHADHAPGSENAEFSQKACYDQASLFTQRPHFPERDCLMGVNA
jgi:hypothetical protein